MEKKILLIAEKVADIFGKHLLPHIRDYLLLLLSHIRVSDFRQHIDFRKRAVESVPGFGPALLCALFLLRAEIEVPLEEFVDSVRMLLSSRRRLPQLPFSALMKRLRQQRGIKLAELARTLNVARGYLHAIERGRSLPSVPLLARIVEQLDPDGREGLALAGIAARLPSKLKQILFSHQNSA